MVNQTHFKMQISKVNEVYLHLEVDSSLSRELADYFTFEVPGAKFMPTYRNRMWDGKIRLYSQQTGKIYSGLLPYIKEFCLRNSIKYIIEEGIENDRNIIREDVGKFIISLQPQTKGEKLQVRDYQLNAVLHALRKHRCLILSPTASGKSLIIYTLVRYYNYLLKLTNKKILILVPTTSLVEQMYSDFIDYGWKDEYIHRIYSGHERTTEKPVIVSTWQSLYKMPGKYFNDFGCVIGDEAHLFKAKSLTSILTKLKDCKFRHGFTGTLDGTQTHRLVLEGLFGSVEKVISTKELIDKKTLAKLNIKCIVLKHSEENCKNMKGIPYAEEINYLVLQPNRNNFICNLCNTLTGNTLVLFQLVEKHGMVLHSMMKDFDRKVFFVYGGTDTKTREDIRAITEKEKDAIIIASYGTFSTGINIKNLHNIVFSSPSKSRIRVLQSIGRGLRTSTTKDSITVFDISDDLSYGSWNNFTYNHFQERINIYNEEEFHYKIDKVKL